MQKCLLLLLLSTLEACCAACAEEPLLDLSPAWRPGEFTMSGLSVSAPGRCKRACLSKTGHLFMGLVKGMLGLYQDERNSTF